MFKVTVALLLLKSVKCLFNEKRLCLRKCQLKVTIHKNNDLCDVIIVTGIGNVIKII